MTHCGSMAGRGRVHVTGYAPINLVINGGGLWDGGGIGRVGEMSLACVGNDGSICSRVGQGQAGTHVHTYRVRAFTQWFTRRLVK